MAWGLGLTLFAVTGFALLLLYRRFPKLMREICQWVAILLISLICGEMALRLYNYFIPIYIFYDSTYNRFKGRPFAEDWDFQLNSRGFKDLEISQEKTHEQRVLGIGDSFAFGVVPYRWNYHTLLEEQLKKGNLDVEVVNMGIPSIGPKEYLDVLVRDGLDLKPDLVMVSFFVGNDYLDTYYQRARRKWYEYSFVTSLIYYAVRVRPHYVGQVIHGKAKYDDDAASFSEEAFLRIEHQRSCIFIRGNKKLKRVFRRAVDYLVKMQQLCARRGIDFIVVIIPDELQVNTELQHDIMAISSPSRSSMQWDWAQPNTMLAEELARHRIEYIDLYDQFAIVGGKKRLYRLRDTHWNIPGNELAAQIIYERLAPQLVNRKKQ
ncbi:MAG: SGNH/GDSL hydrolase family protein [Candidatus Aureabacteria bacterium]|nr:SGNH/GDSL hydrolase family protein [Candidatus Auribacterota bacterium]